MKINHLFLLKLPISKFGELSERSFHLWLFPSFQFLQALFLWPFLHPFKCSRSPAFSSRIELFDYSTYVHIRVRPFGDAAKLWQCKNNEKGEGKGSQMVEHIASNRLVCVFCIDRSSWGISESQTIIFCIISF